jgi:hypothetical protein
MAPIEHQIEGRRIQQNHRIHNVPAALGTNVDMMKT